MHKRTVATMRQVDRVCGVRQAVDKLNMFDSWMSSVHDVDVGTIACPTPKNPLSVNVPAIGGETAGHAPVRKPRLTLDLIDRKFGESQSDVQLVKDGKVPPKGVMMFQDLLTASAHLRNGSSLRTYIKWLTCSFNRLNIFVSSSRSFDSAVPILYRRGVTLSQPTASGKTDS
jgi:hypothetical protein